MRDPITKFPQRHTGLVHARRTLAEIQAILKKPRLSPEMRIGLEQRVVALQNEIAGDTGKQASNGSAGPTAGRTPPNSAKK
jgi:hypothetical protein